MKTNYTQTPFEAWYETYKPKSNPNDPGASFMGLLHDTYNPEIQNVLDAPRNRVWTLVESEGRLFISCGLQKVNRLGYFITEKPWDEDTVIDIDQPEEK